MRFTSLLLAALAAVLLLSCAGRAPRPAPAQANATAPAEVAPAPPAPEAPSEAVEPEPAPAPGMQESDILEPEPAGAKKKSKAGSAKSKATFTPLAPSEGSAPQVCYHYTAKTRRGRCEPQCIPYARCRTGIDSCRLGPENNSLTWFACEQKQKDTTDEPGPGMVMILKANSRRGMPTGHALVVESARPQGKDAWLLVVSHANYDRGCSLEANAKVLYNRTSKRAAFMSGEWKDWATDLAVAGFIRE